MQERHEIRVMPCGEGWVVECNELCQPIVFLTGALAERHARTMAVAMAHAGFDVRLLVCDRQGSTVAGGRYFAVKPEGVWLSIA
jgi:hypothetical protein